MLTTWRRGRRVVGEEMARQSIPMDAFLASVGSDIHRVSGTAIFMTSTKEGVPAVLLHKLKHNQILHDRVVLVTVQTTAAPTVHEMERMFCTRWARASTAW